jgi:hypothetical protein
LANKEIRIPHDKIKDTQTITKVTTDAMKEAGCDIHVNEVSDIQDDFKARERILSVEKRHYFTVGRVPWHKD